MPDDSADQGGQDTDLRKSADRELTELIRALRRYARALVGDDADADDLVQESLKRALTYFDSDRQIGNLRAYLFTILHNSRIDMLKRQQRSGIAVPAEEAQLAANIASPSDRMACNDTLKAIRRLSEEHRQVLLLVGLEGMSYKETADVLNLPIGTVMSRLSRARAALRSALGQGDKLELDGAG